MTGDSYGHHATFTSDEGGRTSTVVAGPAALATDPITTATLPLPGNYPGCRIMRPLRPDPTAVTYEFDVVHDLVLMGGPVVDVSFTTSGPDVPSSVRLWDVAGLELTLRLIDPPGGDSENGAPAPAPARRPLPATGAPFDVWGPAMLGLGFVVAGRRRAGTGVPHVESFRDKGALPRGRDVDEDDGGSSDREPASAPHGRARRPRRVRAGAAVGR